MEILILYKIPIIAMLLRCIALNFLLHISCEKQKVIENRTSPMKKAVEIGALLETFQEKDLRAKAGHSPRLNADQNRGKPSQIPQSAGR